METTNSPASTLPAGKSDATARAASDGHANQVRHLTDQPKDYAPRYRTVSPIAPGQIARIMGEPVDCYQAFREAQLEREALARRSRIQAIVEWFAIAAVIASSIYFAAQLARAL